MSTRQYQAVNPHRVGHYAGLHPEDQPFISDNLGDYEDDEDDDTRPPTSAIRYAPRQGQGTVVYGPPVRRRSRYTASQPAPVQAARQHRHWLVYAGGLLMVGLIGYLAFTFISAWWQSKLDDWQYGMPRTYQTDVAVGHGDSASNPSHFVAQNLKGEIVVIEYPAGDVSKSRAYVITTLPDGDSYSPVTLKFKDLAGNGRLDVLVLIGDPGSQMQVILYNDGKQFAAKP